MGIVRRCGRPPRPALLIQRPTREREAEATARLLATAAFVAHDRRTPPRIPAAWREASSDATCEHGAGDADQVLCGCQRHRRD
jgi:hypothetical protein